MANYSAALRDGRERDTQKGSAVVFAGQHVLAMAARRSGLTTATVGRLLPDTPQLARNPVCSHLWMSKNHYRVCAPARQAYCLHLLRHIRANFPEAVPVLERWGTQVASFVGVPKAGDLQQVPLTLRKRIRVIGAVPPGTAIRDANLDALRPAMSGAWLLPGGRTLSTTVVLQVAKGIAPGLQVRFPGCFRRQEVFTGRACLGGLLSTRPAPARWHGHLVQLPQVQPPHHGG